MGIARSKGALRALKVFTVARMKGNRRAMVMGLGIRKLGG
jgi:hypothetical protein